MTAYTCRPYKNGNAETCTFTNPAAGTYWVMLNAYAAYSGVTLTGTYAASGGGGGDPYLTNGVGGHRHHRRDEQRAVLAHRGARPARR